MYHVARVYSVRLKLGPSVWNWAGGHVTLAAKERLAALVKESIVSWTLLAE